METFGCSSSIISRGFFEENILAILDVTHSKRSQDDIDDRIAFLEAVRAASVVPENGTRPTNKMYQAIFGILRETGNSMELVMESYRLLDQLNKRFPPVYVSNKGLSESSELVVTEEVWWPFVFTSAEPSSKSCSGTLDSLGFHMLIQDLAGVAKSTNTEPLGVESLGNMLLFLYLVNVLGGDFAPRNQVFKETMNWTLVRESLLNMLLSSRKINYKSLMKDCFCILCGLSHVYSGTSNDLESLENSAGNFFMNGNAALALAFPEVGNNTCSAMQKLLIMIMELDMSRKMADHQGCTTRADSVRTPLVEIILDELTYDRDMLSPFLQIFHDPKWKMEIILQYFSKYTAKPSVRTRRSNGAIEDGTLGGVLQCFSNITCTKTIIKKINVNVVQMLLAHAFQAYLSFSSPEDVEGVSDPKAGVRSDSMVEICKSVICAFTNLRRINQKMEILPFGKQALFTAATVLSLKS